MTITTNVEQVKLHIMTEQQYDDSAKSDSELYVITDATAMPMDDELSLSSENPVKNNVIKERFDEVQTELDDKLNKSIVWNKLNRAYGWTYRHLNGAGNAYLMYYTPDGPAYSDAISAQSVIEDEYKRFSIGEPWFICLDNQLYHKTWTTDSNNNKTFTLTPLGENNCSCFASYAEQNSDCLAIINNNLYYSNTSSLYLRDSNNWTKISYCSGSTNNFGFGIKNDNLYYVSNYASDGYIILKDSSGTWSDVCGYTYGNSSYGFGIKDGKLYALGYNSIIKISDDTGWTKICGYDGEINNSNYYGLGIKNGALYSLKGDGITLIDNSETWIKIYGRDSSAAGLTQSGKLYRITSYNQITQIGTDTTWTDISGYFVSSNNVYQFTGINNGDVYCLSTNDYSKIRLTTTGNFTNVYDGFYSSNTNYPTGIFWTGSVTEDVHSVYTVAAPSVDFDTYSNVNLTKYGTITSVNSSPYVVTDEHYTYNRDSSIDGVFTGISPDSSKQLMSMNDFLKCFTE